MNLFDVTQDNFGFKKNCFRVYLNPDNGCVLHWERVRGHKYLYLAVEYCVFSIRWLDCYIPQMQRLRPLSIILCLFSNLAAFCFIL